MNFTHVMDVISKVFAAVGVAVIIVGFVLALLSAARALARGQGKLYTTVRQQFGRSILLGLEILIAADLIRTVAVAPTARNVLILGGIVLIRTVLSLSLEVEIEGTWPWRRWTQSKPETSDSSEPKPG
jgi:uncharacterized membrane protein